MGLQDDISQGLRNVKETSTFQSIEEKVEEVSKAITSAPLYQKTAEGVKAGAEKTGAMFGGLSAKIAAIKESDTFRNLEEKVGSAYTNVKAKVVTTSSSSHDLDEALKEAEAQREAAGLNRLEPRQPHPLKLRNLSPKFYYFKFFLFIRLFHSFWICFFLFRTKLDIC